MEGITLYYNVKSPKRQIKQGRFQLLAASFSIIIGYWETFRFYSGLSLIIPLAGLLIAAVNIPFAIFYKKLSRKYGGKFERLLLQTDGVIMLITGIGYDMAGSIFGPYAYYFLAVVYMVVVPYILLPAKSKRFYIEVSPSGFSLRGMLRRISVGWNEIESFSFQNNVMKVKRTGKRKVYTCYFNGREKNLRKAMHIVKEVQKAGQFVLESEI